MILVHGIGIMVEAVAAAQVAAAAVAGANLAQKR